jgi:hypothetical protein
LYVTFHSTDFPQISYLGLPKVSFVCRFPMGGIFLTHNISQFPLVLQLCKLGCGRMSMRGPLPFFYILVSILGVFLKLHVSKIPRMRYKCLQFSCNWSITKGALPREQSTFSSLSWYPFVQFSEISYLPLPTHTLKTVHFLAIGQTLTHNWAAKYFSSLSLFPVEGISRNFVLLTFQGSKVLFIFISVSSGGNFSKFRTSHFPHIQQKLDNFGSNRSIMKGNLLREQSTFSSASLLPFEGFSSNFKPRRVHTYAANDVTVLAISQ